MPQPPKYHHTLLLVNQYARGGVINSEDMARRMAELILEDMEGAAEVTRSRPFSVEDLGEAWRVKGNPEAVGDREDVGPWEIVIQKLDARVLTLGRTRKMKISRDMLLPGDLPDSET